jgi:hypothetical protein
MLRFLFLLALATVPSIFSSTHLLAQPTLKGGDYVLAGTPHHLYVVDPGGTSIRVYITLRGGSQCTGELPNILQYQLPPNYKNTPINYSSGTCNGTIQCRGLTIRCVNPDPTIAPNPASFSQPVGAKSVIMKSSFISGTFDYSPTKRIPIAIFRLSKNRPGKTIRNGTIIGVKKR